MGVARLHEHMPPSCCAQGQEQKRSQRLFAGPRLESRWRPEQGQGKQGELKPPHRQRQPARSRKTAKVARKRRSADEISTRSQQAPSPPSFQDGRMLAGETGRPPDSAHSPAAGARARSSPHQNRTLALAAAFPGRAPDLSPKPPRSRRVTPTKLATVIGDSFASLCAGASPAPAGPCAPRSRTPSRKIVEAACMSGGVPASLMGGPGGREAPATRSQMREAAPQPAGAGR